jgi:two-component system OmpR family sensor kinase/two-component system sensor histidine kinase BaeS
MAAVVLVVRNAVDSGFRDYINQQERDAVPAELPSTLERYYAENGNWLGADALLPGSNRRDETGGEGRTNRPPSAGQGRQYMIVDRNRQVVVATDPDNIGISLDDDVLDQSIALSVEDELNGWLAWETQGQQRLGQAEQNFLDEMTGALGQVAVGAGLIVTLIGAGFAWHLTRPLTRLTHAVRNVAAGRHGDQVPVVGAQEIRDLAVAFNEMSTSLALSEQQRQRVIADMAHELRTPVTVLGTHLEGILDDVIPNDKDQIALAYNQTLHLKRLIEDLRLLTLAEIQQLPLDKTAIVVNDFVCELVATFEPLALDADLRLVADIPDDGIRIEGDAGRLRQVFGNLLTNALRHSSAGSTIEIIAQHDANTVMLSVSNSGQPLTPDQLEHIFEPFWRADEARDRDQGGSGLGLAIAKRLVDLHSGTIEVESKSNRTIFHVRLPIIIPSQ